MVGINFILLCPRLLKSVFEFFSPAFSLPLIKGLHRIQLNVNRPSLGIKTFARAAALNPRSMSDCIRRVFHGIGYPEDGL